LINTDTQGWQRGGFAPIPYRPAKYPQVSDVFFIEQKKTPPRFLARTLKKLRCGLGPHPVESGCVDGSPAH
jgi:hypothetical protein